METSLTPSVSYTNDLITSGYAVPNANGYAVIGSNMVASTIFFQPNGSPVLEIKPNGDIKWKDRIIEGDDEFREAVIGFYKYINGGCRL
jgi:hypothetical protein